MQPNLELKWKGWGPQKRTPEELPTVALWKIEVWRKNTGNGTETQGHCGNILNFKSNKKGKQHVPYIVLPLLHKLPNLNMMLFFFCYFCVQLEKKWEMWRCTSYLNWFGNQFRCAWQKPHHAQCHFGEQHRGGTRSKRDANKGSVSQKGGTSSLMRFFQRCMKSGCGRQAGCCFQHLRFSCFLQPTYLCLHIVQANCWEVMWCLTLCWSSSEQ